MNTETQAVSDLKVKETLAFCPSDCGSVGDQQVPSKIYSGVQIILQICQIFLTHILPSRIFLFTNFDLMT